VQWRFIANSLNTNANRISERCPEVAMPNGGPDNCSRCGFNKANNGRWPGPGEEQEAPGFCSIRGFDIANPFWTYCKNQHSRQSAPLGPVYGAVYTQGYQRVPWYDRIFPSEGEATCLVCGDHVLTGIVLPLESGDLEFCDGEHYLVWWTDTMRKRLRASKDFGEKAYDEMYDARSSSAATGRYSDAKEAFHDAIAIARDLELPDEMAALQARLDHIKAVFRSQFS